MDIEVVQGWLALIAVLGHCVIIAIFTLDIVDAVINKKIGLLVYRGFSIILSTIILATIFFLELCYTYSS